MKNLDIFIIATGKLWSRLEKLIQCDEFRGENFCIISEENTRNMTNYRFSKITEELWRDNVELIRDSLIDNLFRIQGGNIHVKNKVVTTLDFAKPRPLAKGEISVLSKHQNALERFLCGNSDYVLILEDDAIIEKGAFKILKDLVNNTSFDYYDIAGGDGITCKEENLVHMNGIEGEINILQATRTACAYIASRTTALAIVDELQRIIMPIDWSISVALKKTEQKQQVFWLNKHIITHGSCTGQITSWRSSQWN